MENLHKEIAQAKANTEQENLGSVACNQSRTAALPSWRDELANALTAGITDNGPGNIEVCIASIEKISFDRNNFF